jgi:hypothetical protein
VNSALLQALLLINVLLIGVALAVAVQHAYAHFRPHINEVKKVSSNQQNAHLPPELRKKLLLIAQSNFQAILNRSADELQHDLKVTASRLDKQLEQLGSAIVSEEMKRYQSGLEVLRQSTESGITAAQSDIAAHQAELNAKLAERQAELEAKLIDDMEVEKQQLVSQLDTKLADAVAAFLVETMGHNVDLGAQSEYLTAMLEEHKLELTKGVYDEN